MSVDWQALSRKAGFEVEGSTIRVSCGPDRSQLVNVDEDDSESIRIWSSVVARRDAPENAETRVWEMNRYRELVGFKVADRGRVIGEAHVATVGLTVEEWKLHVLTVARASDRLEFLWTGRDVE